MKRCAILLVLLTATVALAAEPQAPTTATAPADKPMSAAMAEMLGLAPPGAAETTTQPASTIATISIQVIQGTKDGPKITGGKATVELFRGGEPQVIEVNLDAHGVALLENLSLASPFDPRVTIEYAGTSYQAVGEPMTPTQSSQKIEVKVYETTDQRPELTIGMRHVMAIATPEGLRVRDVMVVNNPADRTWTGSPGADGKPSTMWVGLPAGVTDLTMEGGFHSCCARVIDGKLVSSSPLVPGQLQFHVMYLLPGTDGQAQMEINAPAPIGTMILMVPQSQANNVTVEGLEKGRIFPGDGKPMQSFIGKEVAAGQKIVLTMTGMPQAVEIAPEGEWSTPQILGVVGVALLVVLSVLILAFKAGRKAAQASAETPGEKDA